MPGKITPKQQQILDYIKEEILSKGYPPTVREICEKVGLKSTSSVHSHLSTLENNGYIRRDPTKPRAIEIMDDEFGLVRREMTNIPIIGRVAAGAPLLAVGAFVGHLDYTIIWRYFSWTNQTLAMIVLWTASMFLFKEKKNYWITVVPATFMSAVSMTYFFCADECLGFSTAVAYPVGIILAVVFLGTFIHATKKPAKM